LKKQEVWPVDEIRFARPADFHLHLREGLLLNELVPISVQYFDRALVMPNTEAGILTAQDVRAYRDAIVGATPAGAIFEPLMTIKLAESTTAESLTEAFTEGNAVAGKLYPKGVTTNSGDGVRDVEQLYPVFAAMERMGMVLCLHGEIPGSFCLDRETAFLPVLDELAASFPRLRIVMEHVSTQAAVEFVSKAREGVAATITPQHMMLTLDDVVGDLLSPHRYCKPVPKRAEDREALIEAATAGTGKFFLGTDSAPHPLPRKESAQGAAGVFSAPVAIPLVVELFEGVDRMNALEGFCSDFGAAFYGLPRTKNQIALVRQPWRVPSEYAGVVPFLANEEVAWQLAAAV
jgi:dihydroorotase